MSKLHDNPQSLKDMVLGIMGSLVAMVAANWEILIPWIMGILVACYTLYNQHILSKINREKLKKLRERNNEEDR